MPAGKNVCKPLWVIDFPMFEEDGEGGSGCHAPPVHRAQRPDPGAGLKAPTR
ncbi:hypothetical protein ACLK19_12600 [Escherichia coli]